VGGVCNRETGAVKRGNDTDAAVDLVVTDLDGTLWHTDDHVDPDVVAAFLRLQAAGVPVLVATGRRIDSSRRPLAAVGLAPPAVVLNGALGLDLATGVRFHRAPYRQGEAAAVLEAFTRVGLQPVVHVDGGEVDGIHALLGPAPTTHPEHAASFGDTALVGDLAANLDRYPVLGFSVIGVDHAACVAARDAVGDSSEPHLDRSLDYPGLATLTVAPSGQSKWDGVLAYCAAHDLDSTRVLALGDGSNDLELLDNAAVALVPKVAHREALARADHVIPAAAEGGWVQVLDHIWT
jgi:hydroxymethylpyrimidine pyrophosphatase-like HAD family hydrolase